MALKAVIKESKEVALWREYTDENGKVLAEFKIRGDGCQAYKVALERANNQIASNGYDVAEASGEIKLFHELLLQATACHLLEDWKGIEFDVEGIVTPMPFTPENATTLLSQGDIGVLIWLFIKEQAYQIQKDADKTEAEVMGKSETSTGGLDSEASQQLQSTT